MDRDSIYLVVRTCEIEPGTPVLIETPSEIIARRYYYRGREDMGEGLVWGWEIDADPELRYAPGAWDPRGRELLERDALALNAIETAEHIVTNAWLDGGDAVA